MADEDVEVRFGASLEGLTAGIESAKEAIESVKEPIGGVLDAFSGVAEAIGAAFAVEKISEFAERMGELGEATERTSRILGLTTEQVGALDFASKMTGTSADALTTLMGRFQVTLARAAQGVGPAAAGLRALGLSANQLIGVPIPEQLNRIADAVSKLDDNEKKTAALQSLGRGFTQLIPLLDQGREGLERINQTFAETKASLDEVSTKNLVDMQHSFITLGTAIEGAFQQAFVGFAPLITRATEEVTKFVESFDATPIQEWGQNAIVAVGTFIGGAVPLWEAFETIAADAAAVLNRINTAVTSAGEATHRAVQSMIDWFTRLLPSIQAAIAKVEELIKALGEAAAKVSAVAQAAATGTGFTDDFGQDVGDPSRGAPKPYAGHGPGRSPNTPAPYPTISSDGSTVDDSLQGELTRNAHDLASNSEDAAAKVKALTNSLSGLLAKHSPGSPDDRNHPQSKPSAGDLDLSRGGGRGKKGGDEGAKIDETEGAAEVKAAEETARAKERILDEQLKAHQISSAEWLQQTQETLQAELSAVQAGYQRELSAAGLKASQIAKIKADEALAVQKINDQMVAAEQKAAADATKAWQQAADSILQSFNSQIHGLIAGTTSAKDALKNIAVDIASKFIEEGEKTVVNWLIGEANKTAGTVAGNTARTASDASAASAGAAIQVASILKSIGASAAETFAGIFGFLSPIMGPAAAAPAAAGEAQVLSVAGGLYDAGAWSIPYDQVAGLHAGEMVIPSKGGLADQFRQMLGSGGPAMAGGAAQHFHFHGAILDGHKLTRTVSEIMTKNPSLRPKY